jgi:hypothetical protein
MVTNKAKIVDRVYMAQRQDSNFQRDLIFGRKFHSGLDTKTYWLTDRQPYATSTSTKNFYSRVEEG